MKMKFGLEVIMPISIFLFVCSSCFAATPAPGKYTVYKATGGHMKVDDVFKIVEDENGDLTLDPDPDNPVYEAINNRWKAEGDKKYKLSKEGSNLCGFIEVATKEHEDNQFGHNKIHGILVKQDSGRRADKSYIKILWSAYPLNKIPNEKKSRTDKCEEIDTLHHGGMAHASNN